MERRGIVAQEISQPGALHLMMDYFVAHCVMPSPSHRMMDSFAAAL